jgi:hypothetical protein
VPGNETALDSEAFQPCYLQNQNHNSQITMFHKEYFACFFDKSGRQSNKVYYFITLQAGAD